MMITEIRSGGQTGADRAALDAAVSKGVSTGGWVPAGRWAEDGPIDNTYRNLVETEDSDVSIRTKKNVEDSDGTLIITMGEPIGGTKQTIEFARSLTKPFLLIDGTDPDEIETVLRWIRSEKIRRLNVAGPRASEEPQIYSRTYKIISSLLTIAAKNAG